MRGFTVFYFSKNNIFIFSSDFLFISKIKLSSMVVLMKCNCNNTIGYQFWLDVSVSWEKSSNCDKLGKMSCHFTANGKYEHLLCIQY